MQAKWPNIRFFRPFSVFYSIFNRKPNLNKYLIISLCVALHVSVCVCVDPQALKIYHLFPHRYTEHIKTSNYVLRNAIEAGCHRMAKVISKNLKLSGLKSLTCKIIPDKREQEKQQQKNAFLLQLYISKMKCWETQSN